LDSIAATDDDDDDIVDDDDEKDDDHEDNNCNNKFEYEGYYKDNDDTDRNYYADSGYYNKYGHLLWRQLQLLQRNIIDVDDNDDDEYDDDDVEVDVFDDKGST